MRYTEEDKELAREMVKQGKSLNEIARHFGCSYENVRLWVKGVSRPAKNVQTVRTPRTEKKKEKADPTILTPAYKAPELIMPTVVIHRISGSIRRYFTKDPYGVYLGVTSAIDAVLPKDEGLLRYMASFRNYDEYIEELNKLADFGTLWHILCGDVAWKQVDLETLSDRLAFEAEKLGRPPQWGIAHTQKMTKYLLSFYQWVKDYEVEFLGIELPVIVQRHRLASCVDIVCRMNFNKGRTLAIVDLKSGSGLYESYRMQLKAYDWGLRETYPQFNDEPLMLFNLQPVDWEKAPTYKLTNQTGKVRDEVLEGYLNLLPHRIKIDPDPIFKPRGVIGEGAEIEKSYEWQSFYDHLIEETYKYK